MTRTWTVDEIKEQLKLNDNWVVKAVSAIWRLQTALEQETQATHVHNEVGFNAVDANILSSFAEQIQRWNNEPSHRYPNPLSANQMRLARKKIIKYARQLSLIANGEIDATTGERITRPENVVTAPEPVAVDETGVNAPKDA